MGRNYVKKENTIQTVNGSGAAGIRMRFGREQVSNASEQMSSVIPIFSSLRFSILDFFFVL